MLIVMLPAEQSRQHSEHYKKGITVTMTKTVSAACIVCNEQHRPWHLETDSFGLFVVGVF